MKATSIIVPKQNRQLIAARLSRFVTEFLPGQEVEVIFRKRKRERSSPQCRYLNGVAYKLLGDHTGYERDDISEFCCGTYFGWVEKKCPKTPANPKGIKNVPLRTTTTNEEGERDVLSKQDFGDYVAWIQRFGAKHGVLIPDPDPEYIMEKAA